MGGWRVKEKSGSWKGRLQMCTYRERHEDGMRAIQEDLGWWRKVVGTEERSRAGGRAHFLESASGVEMAGAPEAACSRSSYRTDWLATCWGYPGAGASPTSHPGT